MPARFLLDSDGSNFFGHTMTADIEGSVAETVRECAANVTTYLLCAGAGRYYYPTQVGDVAHYDLLREAHAAGKDPFGMLLAALKAAGKETFVTMRMNDVHNPTSANEWNLPRVRKEHPDCIVDPEAAHAGRGGWMAWCLDYSRAEVRDYFLALVREIVNRYPIDGVQLDWMRFPRHLSGAPDEVWDKRDSLTEFTAAAREILKETGRKIALAARVPTSVAGWRYTGMDVGEWARRGLLDFVVACSFLTVDFAMPLADMRAAMGGPRVPLYAGFDFGFAGQVHNPESMRGAASGLYGCGADGIYVFNFPCWTERLGARPYHWLPGLEAPETAAAKPLLFSVAHRRHRIEGVDLPWQLPAPLPADGKLELTQPLPAAALPAWRCIVSVVSGGDVTLAVNGVAAREHPDLRRGELFLEYTAFPDGNRPLRPTFDQCRLFYVDPAALRAGDNVLAVTNASGDELNMERVSLGLW